MSEAQVPSSQNRGQVLVFTGDGKGKTTAALGTMLRAWGHGLCVCVIQFIKDEKGRWGEIKAAERLGIEWHTLGDGFVWAPEDQTQAITKAKEAWQLAQNRISSGQYDLVVLDEFTYPLKFGWLGVNEVVSWLVAHKPHDLNLIITGRDALPELVDYADLVTEMRNVKHPFDRGQKAKRGIEF